MVATLHRSPLLFGPFLLDSFGQGVEGLPQTLRFVSDHADLLEGMCTSGTHSFVDVRHGTASSWRSSVLSVRSKKTSLYTRFVL